MNKHLIVAITLALISVSLCVKKENCNAYTCSETKPDSDTGKCLTVTKNSNGSGRTYEFNHCNDGYLCTEALVGLTTPLDKSYNCVKSEIDSGLWDDITDAFEDIFGDADLKVNLLHDDSCDKDSECFNGTCSSGKCNAKDDGASCLVDEGCKIGSACINLVCTKQKAAGETCTKEYDCANNLNCSGGVCI